MGEILDWIVPGIPGDRPIHLLGIGAVEDIFESVKRGIDLFDCVSPARLARSGYVYILPKSGGSAKNKFRYRIKNAGFEKDTRPLDPECGCRMRF